MAVSGDKHQQQCGSAPAADKGGGLTTPAVLSPAVKKWARWSLLALAACTVATLVFTTVARPQTIGEALAQIRSRPSTWGPVFFIANVVGVAFAAPYAIFQILAGAAFSLPLGYTLAWLGTSAGQCLAFLLGRYLFKDSLESYCMKRVPNFAAIESAIFKDGWKLLVLLKVAPMFPDCVLNYMLSLTSVDFSLFAVVSTVCLAPYTIMYVYIGHVSTNITDTISGRGRSGADGEEDDPRSRRVQIVAAVLSVLAAVMLMVYMVVVVKRALDSALNAQQANTRRVLSGSDDEDDDTRALLAAEEGGLEGDSDTDRDTERPDQQALLLMQGGGQHGGRLQQGAS